MEAHEAEAHAQKAEALAKLRLEETRIETEQKLLDCFEKSSLWCRPKINRIK